MSTVLQAQTTYTFTAAGALQNIGPTQTQVNTAYTSTSLAGQVTVVAGIQYWVVPATGDYRIDAYGGQGYGTFGGRGAHMQGEFFLTAGDTMKILVGQYAGPYLSYPSTTYNHQFGGGGGSFVTYTNNSPLIVAGGGGGNHSTSFLPGCDGQITTSGASGAMGTTLGAGGTNGSGGLAAASADAGGGLLTNGAGIAGGQAFVNGGLGGADEGIGGFGGGGGTSSWNNYRGGGGGGYSGGGGGNNGASCCAAGGGGGSFNAGTNQVNLAGVQTGDGMVVFTQLTLPDNDGGISDIQGFIAPVCAGSYPLNVVVRNFGGNQINPITIQWTLNGLPQPDSLISTVLDTVGGTGVDSLVINLATLNVTSATTIRVWTTLPNNVTDPNVANDTMELFIAAPAIVSASMDNGNTCFGGSDGAASANASGGQPGYSYLWSNNDTTSSIINLGAGQYSVTITDNSGCTHTDSVLVTEPAIIVASDSTNHPLCFGDSNGSTMVSANGGTPGYSILWVTNDTTWGLSGLSDGSYSFTITDLNGCTLVDSVVVLGPSAILLSTFVTDEVPPALGSVDLTPSGGTAPYTFNWSNGAQTEDIANLAAGTYTVTVTDANGCIDTTSAVVSLIIGVLDASEPMDVIVSPNPSNGHFKLEVKGMVGEATLEVFDTHGKLMITQIGIRNVAEVNIAESSGIYFVRVSSESGVVTKRIVINP